MGKLPFRLSKVESNLYRFSCHSPHNLFAFTGWVKVLCARPSFRVLQYKTKLRF